MKKIFFIVLLMPFGVFAQTETNIKQDSVPVIIQNELNKKYASYIVNSAIKIVDKQQVISYKVEVQKKSTLIELLYDNNGKLINKIKNKIYTFDGTENPKQNSTPAKSNDGHNHQH